MNILIVKYRISKNALIFILFQLMYFNSDDLKMAQNHCLKQMIASVPELLKVYDQKELSKIIISMIDSPVKQLEEVKISTIQNFVNCPLFEITECRELLLPAMIKHVKAFMVNEQFNQKVTETLGDILNKLTMIEEEKDKCIGEVMHGCLRTIIQTGKKKLMPYSSYFLDYFYQYHFIVVYIIKTFPNVIKIYVLR